jgi:hypothetical protein
MMDVRNSAMTLILDISCSDGPVALRKRTN